MALTRKDAIRIGRADYVCAQVWGDGSAVIMPVPDGSTAEDLDVKFQAPKVDRLPDDAGEGMLDAVRAAFGRALPGRIQRDQAHPSGVTSTLWQCPSRTRGVSLSPDSIAQTLAQLADQGGATACETVQVASKRGSTPIFTVRGWKA